MKTRIIFFVIFFISTILSFGQQKFRRKIIGISDTYHSISLPNNIFKNLNQDYSDLKIIGTNKNKDSVEVPYIFNEEYSEFQNHYFKLINKTKKGRQYFFTLESDEIIDINNITLKFSNSNFDWRVNLEGSNNNFDWFGIIENYRIVAISNELTNYKFSDLVFPLCNYKYFRLTVNSETQPILTESTSTGKSHKNIKEPNIAEIISLNQIEDNRLKSTVMDLELKDKMPLDHLKLILKEPKDYFRKIEIYGQVPLIGKKSNTKELYNLFYQGYISSQNNGVLKFNRLLTKKIKIVISNEDNEPIPIKTIKISGEKVELIGKFPDLSFEYFLIYGDKNSHKPNYDLYKFKSNIPDSLNPLILGNEENIPLAIKNDHPASSLLKYSLWTIIILSILVIGWFSISMMKK